MLFMDANENRNGSYSKASPSSTSLQVGNLICPQLSSRRSPRPGSRRKSGGGKRSSGRPKWPWIRPKWGGTVPITGGSVPNSAQMVADLLLKNKQPQCFQHFRLGVMQLNLSKINHPANSSAQSHTDIRRRSGLLRRCPELWGWLIRLRSIRRVRVRRCRGRGQSVRRAFSADCR